jgi:hypothetical protein
MSGVAMEALAGIPVWPACLHQLLLPILETAACCDKSLVDLAAIQAADARSRVQRMLLAVFGDLEAVWRDEELQELLAELPLPAMQLPLSSDDLRVASEDTVLYTASKYMQDKKSAVEKAAAAAALAPLVRAAHLSRSALAGQALSSSDGLLHSCYSKQLRSLASYKLVTAGDSMPEAALHSIPNLPAAWKLGKRQLIKAEEVRLEWQLPVKQIAAACEESFAGDKRVVLDSPSKSPPLGGGRWQMTVRCEQDVEDGERGTVVWLGVTLSELPADELMRVYRCTIVCNGKNRELACPTAHDFASCGYWLDVAIMPDGGWDEAAWAAEGLPTSGELLLSLQMHSLGEQQPDASADCVDCVV